MSFWQRVALAVGSQPATCANCRWWSGVGVGEPAMWGDCHRAESEGALLSTYQDDVVETREDFGCVQFEARES